MILEQRATEVVHEMIQLGARFELESTNVGQVFVWRAVPPSQRDAVALYWRNVEKPDGLRTAMVAVIARLHSEIGGVL